jgi:NADPH:quinone reductase-like Zn-dependent oxidoreductase
MKAMRAKQLGGPDQLRLEEAPEPEPQAGQVRIRVHAAGINPADLVRLSGRLGTVPLPYIPGTDVSGEVESLGAGVTHLKPGDRVFGRALTGGYAEKTCLPAAEAVPLPANLSFEEGAAIPIPFYTAWQALHNKAAIKSGESVLVSAGGGGVGVAAIQLARIAGARVITTVGSKDKAEGVMALGAHAAVNYKEQDFVAETQKFTDKKGINVVIENVAADNLAKDFIAAAPYARIVVIGTGTGKTADASFPVFAALMKDVTMLGMSLINAGEAIPAMAKALVGLFSEGKLKAVVSKSYPLADAPKAMEDLLAARVFGKLALIP